MTTMTPEPNYSLAFRVAVKGVLAREGGYVFDSADRGGPTNRGISQRQYPDLDIASITDDDAAAIYWRDYWSLLSLDALPAVISVKMLDVAVHVGPTTAVILLQEALNYLGAGLLCDGQIGPKTRMAVLGSNKAALLAAICGRQFSRYAHIIQRDPSQRRFAAGWAIRAMVGLPREA